MIFFNLFCLKVPFFKLIHKDLLPYLINESVEMIFEKDMYIIKEGEKAKYLFVITRGSATETTSQSFCTYIFVVQYIMSTKFE